MLRTTLAATVAVGASMLLAVPPTAATASGCDPVQVSGDARAASGWPVAVARLGDPCAASVRDLGVQWEREDAAGPTGRLTGRGG